MSKAEHMGLSPSQVTCHANTYSNPKQSTSEQTHKFDGGCKGSGSLENKSELRSANVLSDPRDAGDADAGCGVRGSLQPCSQDVAKTPLTSSSVSTGFAIQPQVPLSELATKSSGVEDVGLPPENEIKYPTKEQSRASHGDMENCTNVEQLKMPTGDTVGNSSQLVHRAKNSPKSRKKYMLRSLTGSDRVLRSSSQDKANAPDSSNNMSSINSDGEKKKRGRKKKRGKKVVADEYSRIRTHLRYLLNRMGYEQSLITAYSTEGWKGLSLEKLKPEKELQRATSEIFRRKLKIRDLFQWVGSLCAEGRLPASLFDSEGQISSEDIFCAKCGSKDLTADNDIILCDGACDRGFHQYCLIPPLLKEDIPPDDEGWLCPGCDCKVDCIAMLNDSQGTNLSITDSWEKVFPEAAAAAEAGKILDHNCGLPSDDSDDNDYDPDRPEIDESSQGDESSSDESDFTTASDESEDPPLDEQHLGLPSDDSEDDDYDPDAPDIDKKLNEESSSSDFSSDSEDLAATVKNDELSGEDESPVSVGPCKDANGHGSKLGRKRKQSLNSELLSIMEDTDQDGSEPISGKRSVGRLDYKKLCDETYGDVSYDSNDDEDYTDADGPRKGGKSVGEVECTPKRRGRPKSKFNETAVSPAKAREGSSTRRSSKYKRLGEAVIQRLYKLFKENQYPDRAAKESLAKELEITYQQVTRWFENARWSFKHSSSMDASMHKGSSVKDYKTPKTDDTPLEPGKEMISGSAICNGVHNKELATIESYIADGRDEELGNQESSKRKPDSLKRRGRKRKSVSQSSDPESRSEEVKPSASLPEPLEPQVDGRTPRRRKSLG